MLGLKSLCFICIHVVKDVIIFNNLIKGEHVDIEKRGLRIEP